MDAKIEKLKEIIKKEGLITKAESQQKIVDIKGEETSWLFDLRNIVEFCDFAVQFFENV